MPKKVTRFVPWQRASRTERIASSLISELLEIKTFYLQGAYRDYFRARSQKSYELDNNHSDAGTGGPVVIGGDNLPSPVGIGLTELPNIKKEFCYCKVAASLNRFK